MSDNPTLDSEDQEPRSEPTPLVDPFAVAEDQADPKSGDSGDAVTGDEATTSENVDFVFESSTTSADEPDDSAGEGPEAGVVETSSGPDIDEATGEIVESADSGADGDEAPSVETSESDVAAAPDDSGADDSEVVEAVDDPLEDELDLRESLIMQPGDWYVIHSY
ncbi:MAG: hypothetical protein U9Q71_01255, partial [Pseudomonadota bacterium]|nr:hypothetical protein [Pseudomonadota bacterium]